MEPAESGPIKDVPGLSTFTYDASGYPHIVHTELIGAGARGAGADPSRRFSTAPPLLPATLDVDLLRKPQADDSIYDPRLAYFLAVVAGWSYADKITLSAKLRYYGFPGNTVHQVSVTNDAMLIVATAYFIRSEDGELGILSFRGTEPMNFINWLTDADVTWRTFVYGSVHAGFFANVEALWGGVADILRAAMSNEAPTNGNPVRKPLKALYITGHSLGAAMAVVAAARLTVEQDGDLEWRNLVRGVYTFGQPMVGDKKFADGCKGRFNLFRHVYRADLVCRMPPRVVDEGFVHFGEERFSASPSEPWEVTDVLRAKPAIFLTATVVSAAGTFITRRIGLLRHLNLPYSLDDHSPTNYVEASRSTLLRR